MPVPVMKGYASEDPARGDDRRQDHPAILGAKDGRLLEDEGRCPRGSAPAPPRADLLDAPADGVQPGRREGPAPPATWASSPAPRPTSPTSPRTPGHRPSLRRARTCSPAGTPTSGAAEPIPVEIFTAEERAGLAPYFTNLDGPVFALVNLPEVVKGALFARYSRSAKSLRRLFLDEFLEQAGPAAATASIGTTRAEALYERVFSDYGDDSVAQLGGVHLACEGASNLLTKVLEWGRLMAYLGIHTLRALYGPAWAGLEVRVPAELSGHRPARAARDAGPGLRDLCPPDRAHAQHWRALPARLRTARRLPYDHSPRRWTSADSCRRPPAPTWASSVRGRPTRPCCCGCAPTRSGRCRTTRG